MKMTISLTDKEIEVIINVIKRFPEIETVILFGSRATGENRRSSDVDIAVKGTKINFSTILRLRSRLEDTNLPYFFDVVWYEKLTNQALKKEIDTKGVVIFERE